MKVQLFRVRAFAQWCALVVALSFFASELAFATGFFINQQSVKGRGRVDAGNTAAADELGTVFFNPAGLIEVFNAKPADSGSLFAGPYRLHIGSQLIVPRSTQNNTGSSVATAGTGGAFVPVGGPGGKDPTDPTFVPNVYFAYALPDRRAAFGFGVNVPFGLKAEFGDDWYGRYDAIEASLRTWNISVVGALKIDDRLSIGGGFDVQYARTTLTTAIPNPLVAPSPATDARIGTVGHDWTPGFNVGLLYRFSDDTRVGVHYRHGMKHEIKGESATTGFTGLLSGFNGVTGARADLYLPAVATAGVWHRLSSRVVLLGEVEWYDWSKFDEVVLRFDNGSPSGIRTTNYRDAFGVAVGAEYSQGPMTWRGGVKVDRTPTRDGFRDTTVPDSDRLWLGLGFSQRLTPSSSLDLAFNHVFFRSAEADVTRTFPGGTVARTTGSVKSRVNTIALDFRILY